MKVRPLGSKVLVKLLPVITESTGGILLATARYERPNRGHVIDKGPGRPLESGKREVMDVEIGDLVECSKYGGDVVEHDGEKRVLFDIDQILLVIE